MRQLLAIQTVFFLYFTLTGVVAPVGVDDESGPSQPAAGVLRSAGRLRPTAIEEPPSDKKRTRQFHLLYSRFSHNILEILK